MEVHGFSLNKDIITIKRGNQSYFIFYLHKNQFTPISPLLYKILVSVQRNQESTLDEVYSMTVNNFISYEEFIQVIGHLTTKGILNSNPLIQNCIEGGMFNSNITTFGEALRDQNSKYIFVGFPYELGISNRGGCKFGPTHIRRGSLSVFDIQEYNKIMRNGEIYNFGGITSSEIKPIFINDCGDVKGRYFEKNGKEFDFLTNVVGLALMQSKFPIILGGDHSIFYPELLGISQVYDQFGVIQFDAHTDFGGNNIHGLEWREKLTHGNFWSWGTVIEQVDSVTQLGIREFSQKFNHPKIKSYNVIDSLNNLEEIISSLRRDIPYYITFDVDCMDMSQIGSTGTPLAGGFTFREIIMFLSKISDNLNVIGADIVEYGEGTSNENINISQLILNMIILLERKKQDKC